MAHSIKTVYVVHHSHTDMPEQSLGQGQTTNWAKGPLHIKKQCCIFRFWTIQHFLCNYEKMLL